MSKKIMLENIEELIQSVKQQRQNLSMLKLGSDVLKEEMRTKESCSFYDWFENDGEELKAHILGSTLSDIANLHEAWFDQYLSIYELYYGKDRRGWFSNKNKPKKLSSMENSKLEAYTDDISTLTTDLLSKLDLLIQRISARETLKFER